MAESKQEVREKRSASQTLAVIGALGIAVALVAGAAAYLYQATAVGVPAAVAGTGIAAASFTLSGLVARRTRLRDRMVSFLHSLIGPGWNPETDLKKAARYVDGTPQEILFTYPKGLPDHSAEWRDKMELAVRERMGTDAVRAEWNHKRSQVKMRGYNIVLDALDKARQEFIERTHLVLKPLFRGVDLNLGVSEWSQEDELRPLRMELKYGVTALDGSDLWQRKVEAMAGLKIGGRWRAVFDPTRDHGYLEPRPELPKSVIHPGVSLYAQTDKKSPTLYYGVDENGKPRGWTIGKKSTMPHMLAIGPTGGGKTTVLRSLLTGAVAQGIPVFGCDPKMIELTPFYGFPGVWIASTPEEMASMIESMEALMYERYDAIKKNPKAAETLTPVLFILDELLILRQVLKRHWATPKPDEDGKMKKGTGTPPWFEAIAGLLALARSAMINVVIGVQRPDATLFDDGARDNLRQRLSLMRLSAQGSQMLWGSGFVGVDLPMIQGRAMAAPDGENPIEMQTFWVADPVTAEGQDRVIIDGFREKAAELFAGFKPPINTAPYENAMPSLDVASLPTETEEIEVAAPDDVSGDSGLLDELDTQQVAVETLTAGDKIILDSGETVEILEIDEDPFDDDAISLTIDTAAGTEAISYDRRDNVARVMELVDA